MRSSEAWEQRNLAESRVAKEFYRDYYAAKEVFIKIQTDGHTPVRRLTPLVKSKEELEKDIKQLLDSIHDDWARYLISNFQ